ncbi:hypothetical protein LEM8419_00458 [Neolewinella maritima]|uniref:Arrestin-like N-terminal domain-containing protein n=1 Tax=Neolewinella maritima TaxID=1383882 RepID=A0ABN8F510_9BACT|nr:hypothetical protein [Neolewinella maritima]CAH0999161.1 hypothetical protein LEM8419_00458 [Neolewinella maritima]
MHRPHHSGHPPWGRKLHRPASLATSTSVWKGLRVSLTPKQGKRFRIGERIAGTVTFPPALNPTAYRWEVTYTQRVQSRESEQLVVLGRVAQHASDITTGPTYPFRFSRPISGIDYRSREVHIEYYVEVSIYAIAGAVEPLLTRRVGVQVVQAGIAYAVEPVVLPLLKADAGTVLAGAAGALFVTAAMVLISTQLALWFGVLVGIPLLLRGVHYGLTRHYFGRAGLRIGPSWDLGDVHFDPDGRFGLLDATLVLRVTERATYTDEEGNPRVRRREVYRQTTHLLDAVAQKTLTGEQTIRLALPAPDDLLPTSTTTRKIACFWDLTYRRKLTYWPIPLRKRWPLRVSMKRKSR